MKLTKDEKKALSALATYSDIWAEKFPDGKWLIHGSKVRGRTLEGLVRKRMNGRKQRSDALIMRLTAGVKQQEK